MRRTVTALLLMLSIVSFGQVKKTKILLIGTFHFNNPGKDAVKEKDFDILSAGSQKELESIADRIRDFRPTQFFVEWGYDEQRELDSLYRLYLDGSYFSSLNRQARSYRFYSQAELFQLAFRVSKKAGIKRVTGIDYENTQFPYDSVIAAMKDAGQTGLLDWNEQYIRGLTASSGKEQTITQKLLGLNTEEDRRENRSWYIGFANRAGSDKTFAGAYLASEWYKRNLYMYSQIQKKTTSSDERVVVLLGSGHTAMIEQFVKDDDRFELVDLRDVLK